MPDCLEMPYQPAVRGAEMGNEGEFIYRLGGNSCLSGDYMGLWSFDHELQIGERIVFEDMIHYTMVKTNMFNGIHHPAIALWTKKGKRKYTSNFLMKTMGPNELIIKTIVCLRKQSVQILVKKRCRMFAELRKIPTFATANEKMRK